MAEHDSKERIVPFTHETAKRRYLDYRNDIRVAAFAYGLKLDVDGSKGLAEVYASVIDGEKDPSDIVSLARCCSWRQLSLDAPHFLQTLLPGMAQ